jgi:diguanylate cyclase (GGDEF)-like protein
VKQKPVGVEQKRTAMRRPRLQRLRKERSIFSGLEAPPSKQRSRKSTALLAAEVERLAAELKASRSRITELEARIDVDPLTETLNRRGFERELKRSIAYVKRYGVSAALVYVDLDEFKPINDRHGHAAGDAMLKAVAAKLVGDVRASDVVARIGGDEFVLLLWNVNEDEAATKAGELEAAIYATPVRWGASTLVVGAAAGVAMIGRLDAPAEVLARADAAMYARKAERRNRHSENRAAAKPAVQGFMLTR